MAYAITIKQGNLLEEPSAQFIVNPSNTVLALGSGVSGAFASACGPALQRAMTARLHETGTLRQGDVVVTGGGGCTQFGHVLHAAVMDYNPGAVRTVPTLLTVRTILQNIETVLAAEAQKTGQAVILVLPMMGTGVGGLRKEEVLEVYRDFFMRPVPFECGVILYAHSASDREMMQRLW